MQKPQSLLPLLLLPLAMVGSLCAQDLPGWNLVWSDEFSQVNGSKPDPQKWGYDLGGGGWGNSELQYYTDRTKNARIEDDHLIIEAHAESFGGRNYTSARLLTQGKWDWQYGRFEARLKVPAGQGLWPAFWMLGSSIDEIGWPFCGEIDIMEYVGRLPDEIFGTIHGPGYSGGDSFGQIRPFPDVADEFHTFVVEWEEDEIRWYVDGDHYFTATPDGLNGLEWVFDAPQFILLNLAVGGNFGGPVSPSLNFPKQYLIDYVRVYEKDLGPPPLGSNILVNSGFETSTLSPWQGYTPGGVNSEGAFIESTSSTYFNGGNPGGDNVLTRSGEYVAKVFGDFTGGENDNGFYQEIAAEPGTIWSASGWALSHPQDLIANGLSIWIEASFRSANGSILARHRSPEITRASITPGAWEPIEVTEQWDVAGNQNLGASPFVAAPPGTTTLRYEVIFRQPEYEGGSVYFDDLQLVRLEPPVEELLLLSLEEDTTEFTFQTRPYSTYRMLVSETLDAPSWTTVDTFVGDGSSMNFSYPRSADRRFYRVEMTSP